MANQPLKRYDTGTSTWVGVAAGSVSDGVNEYGSEQIEFSFMNRPVINGSFQIWQRGSSFTSPGYNVYTADRWTESGDGTIGTFAISRQSFTNGQTDVPNNPKYFYRHIQTVAGSGQTFRNIQHKIEGVTLFAGRTVTFSFYAKADASRSVKCGLFRYYGTGGSPSAFEQVGSDQTIALTTTWKKFEITLSIPSVSGKTVGTNKDDCVQLVIGLPLNTTFTMDLAEVQLCLGSTSLPLQSRSFAEELFLCQRYFQKSYSYDRTRTVENTLLYGAHEQLAQGIYVFLNSGFVALNVPMRTIPTVTPISINGNSGKFTKAEDGSEVTGQADTPYISENLIKFNSPGNLVDNKWFRWHWYADAEL